MVVEQFSLMVIVLEQVELEIVVEQMWLVAWLVEQMELDMVLEQLWLVVLEHVELEIVVEQLLLMAMGPWSRAGGAYMAVEQFRLMLVVLEQVELTWRWSSSG